MDVESDVPKNPYEIFRPLSEAEVDMAYSGPAVLSNKFYVSVSGMGARIAFAEESEGRPAVFRTAVFLSLPDAVSLSKVLKELIKEIDGPISEEISALINQAKNG